MPADHLDEMVDARTLDDIVGNEPCAFVKLDAEGAEPRILAGALRTLTQCRPIVLAELNPLLLARVARKTAGEIIGQMSAYGYVTRRLYGNRLEIIERYDDPASINVVFSPANERAATPAGGFGLEPGWVRRDL